MSNYRLWGRMNNYDGSYGKAKKTDVHSISANRFEQAFFNDEDEMIRVSSRSAGDTIQGLGLNSAEKRDYAVDHANPKEELPPDIDAMRQQDIIPMYGYSPSPNVMMSEDYKLASQVKLVQDSFYNWQRQNTMYTDPSNYFDDRINTDKVGQEPRGKGQKAGYGFEGSAAGLVTNTLTRGSDDNFNYDNSVEVMTAF